MALSQFFRQISAGWKNISRKTIAGCLLLAAFLCCCCLALTAGLGWRALQAQPATLTPDYVPTFSIPPALVFTPQTLLSAQSGHAYQAVIQVKENVTPVFDMRVIEGELPPGLTLEFSEQERRGVLSGVPYQAGEYTFQVAAYCYGTMVSGQTGVQEYTLTVVK